jgi:hypothetical protein
MTLDKAFEICRIKNRNERQRQGRRRFMVVSDPPGDPSPRNYAVAVRTLASWSRN